MHDSILTPLQTELVDAGVAPRHVRRIMGELSDHLDDLQTEALESGQEPADARRQAIRRLGDTQQIARRILAEPSNRAWIYRYPRVARIYLPLAYALLLPAAPVFAGLANPAAVIRWSAALMLSAGVTAAMLLCMQLAIVLT